MHIYKPSIQKQKQEDCELKVCVDNTDGLVSKTAFSEVETFHLGGKL